MSIRPEDWPRVREVFEAALAVPAIERHTYVTAACGGDDALLAAVEELLASHDRASAFLETPARATITGIDDTTRTTNLEGLRVGPYQITARIGAGGMGEVYRARDTKLGRDVAIKLLPTIFTNDPERLARFEREARMLAALNHPHIGAIYGLDEITRSTASGEATVPALVLELVEGPTLADRVAAGPLAVHEALAVARQIAEALEAAHDKGIIHRDLKPANIKITANGVVKVLDFGVAKMFAGDQAHPDVSHVPTAGAAGTREDMILGTPAYMSPEQARGQQVDKRTDIWAFGCVVYEMLTGRSPFPGDTIPDMIAAVLERQPDWRALPRGTPAGLRRLLERCLAKDARQRLRDIGEARIALIAELDRIRDNSGSRRFPTPAARFAMWAAAAAMLALAALVSQYGPQRQTSPTSVPAGMLTRLTFDSGLAMAPALSPDGRLVAYASDRAGEGNLDIWVQQVAGGEPLRLTQHAADEFDPTFSPDGTQIAFRSDRDRGGIYLVSALGGEPRLLAPNGYGPRFSPDGQWVAYHTGSPDAYFPGRPLHLTGSKTYVVRPAGGAPRQVQPGAGSALVMAWSPDSRYLLMLASFEGRSFREWWVAPLEGAATGVDVGLLGQNGLLGGPRPGAYPVAWLPGNRIVFTAQSGDSRNYWTARLSGENWRIEQPLKRLTFGAGIEGYGSAVAAEGGMRLVFSSDAQNVDLWNVPLDQTGLHASGPPLQLTQDAATDSHPNLTPDGKTLIWVSNRQRRPDLWARDLATGRETTLLSMAPFWLHKPVVSPDGSKLGFFRMESGWQPPSATFVSELRSNPDGTLRAGQPVELPKSAVIGSGWPWSWSPDGQHLWYDPNLWPRLAPNNLYDVNTREILAHFGYPQHDLRDLSSSPDGRWLAFLDEDVSDNSRTLFIAPIDGGVEPAASNRWIPITSSDPSPGWIAWSPAGDVLYYESNRDGYACVWAQRLARDSMKPVGPPVAIHHAHGVRLSIGRIGPSGRGLAAARDKVIFNMAEKSGSIWMADFADDGNGPRESAGR